MPGTGPFVGSEFSVADFDDICAVLREQGGLDLSRYKDVCVKRRIAARVRELGYLEPRQYINRLRIDAEELRTLLEALAIHVSRFYRDGTTFAVLREHYLPELAALVLRRPGPILRIWSAGCAGGEEAYSLALLAETLPEVEVSIVGSDFSTEVLERARLGLFEAGRLSELSPEERMLYFVAEGREFQLSQKIRERVSFEKFNLLAEQDYPPADLILCRYVLIYFSAEEQRRVVRRFASALAPGGLLVLGRTERLRDEEDCFEVANASERIYRKKA